MASTFFYSFLQLKFLASPHSPTNPNTNPKTGSFKSLGSIMFYWFWDILSIPWGSLTFSLWVKNLPMGYPGEIPMFFGQIFITSALLRGKSWNPMGRRARVRLPGGIPSVMPVAPWLSGTFRQPCWMTRGYLENSRYPSAPPIWFPIISI